MLAHLRRPPHLLVLLCALQPLDLIGPHLPRGARHDGTRSALRGPWTHVDPRGPTMLRMRVVADACPSRGSLV